MASTVSLPVSYDFNNSVSNLINYLQNQDEFKDYNYDGSAITELIRLLSYNEQIGAFRTNFMFNEMDLRTANIYENVASTASTFGYIPASQIGATLNVDVTIIPDNSSTAPSSITITQDNGFSGALDNVSYTFYPTTETSINYDSVNNQYLFSGLSVKQGAWKYYSYTISSNDSVESFSIPSTSIDTTTLNVSIYPSTDSSTYTVWNEVTSGYDLGSSSEYYFLRLNRDGYYEIEFGDGTILAKPVYGSIVVVNYMETAGTAGNNISTVDVLGTIGGYTNITVVATDSALSAGGTAAEGIESIRQAAPLVFQTVGNAVTDTDYVALTKKLYSNASDVIAYGGETATEPKPGYVYVAVKPVTGTTLTTTQKSEVYDLLSAVNVGSITPIIIDPNYIYINVTCPIIYNPKKTVLPQQSLINKYVTAFGSYSDSYLGEFNDNFSYANLVTYISSVDTSVSDYTITTQYEQRFVPTLNTVGIYTFSFSHAIIAGSVLIENFMISDVNFSGYTYSMYDDSNGNISLWKTNGTTPVKMQSNIGTVNYTTGYISLTSFNPVSITADYVSVYVTPVTTDQSLASVSNSILQIGTASVTATTSNV